MNTLAKWLALIGDSIAQGIGWGFGLVLALAACSALGLLPIKGLF